MAQQQLVVVENNFTKGLLTEYTGLNFPENAATDCVNTEFTLIGDVIRREGIDYEVNASLLAGDRTGRAVNTYKWNNAGGNGQIEFVVTQVGPVLNFYESSAASVTTPLSGAIIGGIVTLSNYLAPNVSTFDLSSEATFADGNGYLFVYHPSILPLYVQFNYQSATLTVAPITIQIRDFLGTNDGLPINTRPQASSVQHTYNLLNQGWTSGQPWSANSTTAYVIGSIGSAAVFTVQSGLTGIVAGQNFNIVYVGSVPGMPSAGTVVASGTINSYSGTSLGLNITSALSGYSSISTNGPWIINPTSIGFITTFLSAANLYPSNADVWWYYKDDTGAYNPSTTLANVALTTGTAPSGHYIFDAFHIDRAAVTSQVGISQQVTSARPTIGAWFQGRVWYSGVNDTFQGTGDLNTYAWMENIYFSQIVSTSADFGKCYQTNDPTSSQFFDILPTDGGVITIQGCGRIFKLFPTANGLIVFAANGVWFITGSQGIGFSATDYTITRLAKIRSISSTSFVDVMGLPYFWNEEGIYEVVATQQGQLSVQPITVSTILTYYNNIPLDSKKHARGDYDPVNYVIQWIFKTQEEVDLTSRYSFDGILNYNVYNKAFFPYEVSNALSTSINGITYVASPGGIDGPVSAFKYFASNYINPTFLFTFADEHDTTYVDWKTAHPVDFTSYFVTGFKIRGQGIKRFQPQYIQVWSRIDPDIDSGYNIQGFWDYATSDVSGRMSQSQNVYYKANDFTNVQYRRHKIRGHGYALQLQVTSTDGMPFDIIGWAVIDTVNAGT